MTMTARLMLAAVAACALGAPARAQNGDDPPSDREAQRAERLFTSLDSDGDGYVVADEVDQGHSRLFRRLVASADEDQDGKLSRDEFTAGLIAQRADRPAADGASPSEAPGERPDPMQLFRRWDANGDAVVTLDEVPEQRRDALRKILSRADDNQDNAFSLEEFSKAFAAIGRAIAARADGPPAGGPLMRALDSDRDGRLSAAEIAAASEALMQLDRDSDGQLSGAELQGGERRPRRTNASDRVGGAPIGRLVARIMQDDENGDGRLSKDEVRGRLKENFDDVDTNGDGYLERDELRERMSKVVAQRVRSEDEARPARREQAPNEN